MPGMAIAEMTATQKKNTRAKTDKVYHLVISFPEGEHPTDAQLADIEETFAQKLGFAEHQRLSAVHRDTDNHHLHVVINKIHPKTFNCLEPYNDYFIRDQACAELEKKHGLTIDNHGRQPGSLGKVAIVESQGDKESLLSWVRTHVREPLLQCYETKTWQALHECLAQFNLEIKPRGAGLVIAEKGGGITVKASSVDANLSLRSLTDRLGKFEAPSKSGSVQPPLQTYQKPLLCSNSATDALYKEYKQQHNHSLSLRKSARTRLRTEHTEYDEKMKAWWAERRKNIKHNPLLSRDVVCVVVARLCNICPIIRPSSPNCYSPLLKGTKHLEYKGSIFLLSQSFSRFSGMKIKKLEKIPTPDDRSMVKGI